jgi:hypothetical protein
MVRIRIKNRSNCKHPEDAQAMIDGYMQIREKQVLKNFIRFEHIREE